MKVKGANEMSEELISRYDTMTTRQLEDLLRADADGNGNLDTDSLFCIMELLAARQAPEARSTAEAYAEFREEYMPRQEKKGKRWIFLGVAAAVAAIAILVTALIPPAPQPAKPREFTLQSLAGNTVAITDSDGNFAALGTVSCDGRVLSACIDDMDVDDDYTYFAVVTYSYSSAGTGNIVTENFFLTTAEEGFEIRQVVYPQGSVSQLWGTSAAFYAVEKAGNGEAKLIAEVESIPFAEEQRLPNINFY
jgi:hypothetical protein